MEPFILVELSTKRGIVRVTFNGDGSVFTTRPLNIDRWPTAIWKREQSKLIRRARNICAKVAGINTLSIEYNTEQSDDSVKDYMSTRKRSALARR